MDFKDFKIVSVDKEHIEKDATQSNAFKFPLVLNAKPDDLWVKFMHQAYRLSSFSKKRQYVVLNNLITVIIFGEDNVQAQVDSFKEVINAANTEYRRMLEKKEQEHREEEERKRKDQEAIGKLRGDSDKLIL